jgi:hypothetical protein
MISESEAESNHVRLMVGTALLPAPDPVRFGQPPISSGATTNDRIHPAIRDNVTTLPLFALVKFPGRAALKASEPEL